MNATHPFSPEEVMAYLDGELSPAAVLSIATHIEQCDECSEAVIGLRKTSGSLADWMVPGAPASSQRDDHLLSTARDAPSGFASRRGLTLHAFLRRPWLPATASVAVAAVLLLSFFFQSRTFNPPLPQAVRSLREEHLSADVQSVSDEKRRLVEPEGLASSVDRFIGADRLQEQALSQPLALPRPGLNLPAPMIARTISLSIVTKDFDGSRKSLDTILARNHGYSSSLTVSTEQDSARSLDASLRIPAAELTAAVAELKSLGYVNNESQNGEEVTQQHADLVARLKNSRETEQRLQAILQQRTGKISDVLAVEQEIARVRGEIEQMEAEQQTLERRVDFATIDLKLAEEYKAQLGAPAASVSNQLRNALVSGLRTAANSVLSIVLFLSESGPVLLLWLAILALPARQLWRRYRRAVAI